MLIFSSASLVMFTLWLTYFYQSNDVNSCELCGFVYSVFLALPVNHPLPFLGVQRCQDYN